MGREVVLVFINLFVSLFNILILARVLTSWVPSLAQSAPGRLVHELTEPLLAPVRKLLPQSQFLDISPLVVFFLLRLVSQGVNSYLM